MSKWFRPLIFRVFVPPFPKIGSCSLVPFDFFLCSLVPQNPWETLNKVTWYWNEISLFFKKSIRLSGVDHFTPLWRWLCALFSTDEVFIERFGQHTSQPSVSDLTGNAYQRCQLSWDMYTFDILHDQAIFNFEWFTRPTSEIKEECYFVNYVEGGFLVVIATNTHMHVGWYEFANRDENMQITAGVHELVSSVTKMKISYSILIPIFSERFFDHKKGSTWEEL